MICGETSEPDPFVSRPITFHLDSKGTGRADIVVFQGARNGRWNRSWIDTDGDGKYDTIGYHPDGTLGAARYEPMTPVTLAAATGSEAR